MKTGKFSKNHSVQISANSNTWTEQGHWRPLAFGVFGYCEAWDRVNWTE